MAGQNCTVCSHPQRDDINTALLRFGRSFSRISVQYGVKMTPLYDHYNRCIRELVMASEELRIQLSVERLLARLMELDDYTQELLQDARAQGDTRTALMAIREARANIEMYFRLGPAALLEEEVEGSINALKGKASA